MSSAVIAEEPSVPVIVKFLSAVGTSNTASPLFALVRDIKFTLFPHKLYSLIPYMLAVPDAGCGPGQNSCLGDLGRFELN